MKRAGNQYRGVMTDELEAELEAEQAYYRALAMIGVPPTDAAVRLCGERIHKLQTEIERRRS